MTCQELVDLLLDFMADELEPVCCAEIEEHLLRCPSCEAYVHNYRITITITRRLPDLPMPNQLAKRLLDQIKEFRDLDI